MATLSQSIVERVRALVPKYPRPAAALIPALKMIQDEVGHITAEAEAELASVLSVEPAHVHGVATFYAMLRTRPAGRHFIRICRNICCQLRGANELIALAEQELGIKVGQTTPDGMITLETEECLASCATAPVIWCDGHYHERVDEQGFRQLVADLH